MFLGAFIECLGLHVSGTLPESTATRAMGENRFRLFGAVCSLEILSLLLGVPRSAMLEIDFLPDVVWWDEAHA